MIPTLSGGISLCVLYRACTNFSLTRLSDQHIPLARASSGSLEVQWWLHLKPVVAFFGMSADYVSLSINTSEGFPFSGRTIFLRGSGEISCIRSPMRISVTHGANYFPFEGGCPVFAGL